MSRDDHADLRLAQIRRLRNASRASAAHGASLHACKEQDDRPTQAVVRTRFNGNAVAVVVRVVGCAVGARSAHFVLTVDSLDTGAYPTIGHPWSSHYQRKLSDGLKLVAKLNTRSCQLTHLQWAVRARCLGLLPRPFRPDDHPFATLDLALVDAKSTSTIEPAYVPLVVSLGPKRIQARDALMHCSSVVAFGRITEQVAALRKARNHWAQIGSRTSFVFARTRSHCNRLERIPNVTCDVISSWRAASDPLGIHGGVDVRSNWTEPSLTPWFDQPLLQLVCLIYAQLVKSPKPYLAFTDLDELPPPAQSASTLMYALKSAQNYNAAGVRLFFDAELRCPSRGERAVPADTDQNRWCPSSSEEWMAKCPHPTIKAAEHRRIHWKPIVVPERIYTLSPHTATPVDKFRGLLDMWSDSKVTPLCLKHLRLAHRSVNATLVVPNLKKRSEWRSAMGMRSQFLSGDQSHPEQMSHTRRGDVVVERGK